MDADSLAGWIPLFLSTVDGKRTVDWAYMGEERFVEPFCHDTLHRLAARPFNRLFRRQSDVDLLRQREIGHPGLPLAGIVFHMSRCGSTLLSQWLAALPDSVTLSEPEPLDTLLQWPASEGDAETLRALLAALGQARRPDDRRLFLKTDCWHLLHADRLLAAFPGVPWIFLYRDPVEVLVSHARQPGWQCVPGSMAAHGLAAPEEVMSRPLAHGAWILSLILARARIALEIHPKGISVNYADLPVAMTDLLPRHFGIAPETAATALATVGDRHAKRRHETFRPDGEDKLAAADGEIRDLAERWLAAPYRALETLRPPQAPG